MGRVTYITHDGERHTVELADGTTVMQGAISNEIPGIDGDCGGCLACGTCHVHIDPQWRAAVGPIASPEEADMLQFSAEVAEDSRLSCQIRMRKELDGLIVHLPEAQH
jgi:2Fe-2S ferredoxin